MALSVPELLNKAWSHMVKDLDSQGRAKLEAAMEGRLGPHGGILVDDPDLPADLQGKEAPSWWDGASVEYSDEPQNWQQ